MVNLGELAEKDPGGFEDRFRPVVGGIGGGTRGMGFKFKSIEKVTAPGLQRLPSCDCV